MGYISTAMGDRFGALLMSLMALELTLEETPFNLVKYVFAQVCP